MEKRKYFKIYLNNKIYFKSYENSMVLENLMIAVCEFFDYQYDYEEITKEEYENNLNKI